MNYLFKFIFSFPRSGVEAKRGVEFDQTTRNASGISRTMDNWSVLTLGSSCLPRCVWDIIVQYFVILKWSGVIKRTESLWSHTLHKVSMDSNTIFKTLHTLNIGQMFVYRAIDRYNSTSFVLKRSSRPPSIRTKKVIKAVRETIRRNPIPKQKILSRQMNTAHTKISHILKDDLKLSL